MEIEKTLVIAAPAARVWELLLDPQVMGACVPGMQSIEVISDVEYISHIQVKIAFVSARFKIKTTIVEQRAPHYLRSEGTGEDASVASSLKQVSEVFLTEQTDGQTELRMKIKVDVLGRLGTFGLNVMKTKADRMWDEFCTQLTARVAPPAAAALQAPTPAASPAAADAPAAAAASGVASAPVVTPSRPSAAVGIPIAAATARHDTGRASWWSRLFPTAGPNRYPVQREPTDICIELRRGDTTLTVHWPTHSANECATWLREYLK